MIHFKLRQNMDHTEQLDMIGEQKKSNRTAVPLGLIDQASWFDRRMPIAFGKWQV